MEFNTHELEEKILSAILNLPGNDCGSLQIAFYSAINTKNKNVKWLIGSTVTKRAFRCFLFPKNLLNKLLNIISTARHNLQRQLCSFLFPFHLGYSLLYKKDDDSKSTLAMPTESNIKVGRRKITVAHIDTHVCTIPWVFFSFFAINIFSR